MDKITVSTPNKSYPIYIERDFDSLYEAVKVTAPSKICIVSDTNVAPLYLEEIKKILSPIAPVCTHVFPAGESNKHIDTIKGFYECFIENKLDRKSALVALGGGVVGDMTGFAAATYMRGIKFIQIPTTLLAQVDSSVGGKTGVDFNGNKNMVGAFYQPELVYINSATLNTLEYRQVAAGLAEAIKYGFIIDKPFLDFFITNREKIMSLDSFSIDYVIAQSCRCKAFVVDQDEKEQGLRAILNFGHTFGHAVETLYDFTLLHGECVAIGMVAALYYAYKLKAISKEALEKYERVLLDMKLPVRCDLSPESIYEQMFLDKKTTSGKLKIITIKAAGSYFIDTTAKEEDVLDAIRYITS
ncbi:MAG: 3-dehydroquinate synthase [Firmicutes bacterium]|nr:3-dehydroquinate synthase [Bacillota bacterium]